MSHERNQDYQTSAAVMTGHSALVDSRANDSVALDLAKLLDRCQDDLVLMDSILNELENSHESDNDDGNNFVGRIDSAESIAAPHLRNDRIAALGAVSVHRMANDIEELYRSASSGGVQMMLDSLQTKMAHCLKLLPASQRQPSRQTSDVVE
jgi:hypothetical protein